MQARGQISWATTTDRIGDHAVYGFLAMLDESCPQTRRHCQRVAEHAAAIGWSMGLGAGDLALLRSAALLHDIGKTLIPEPVLYKDDELTEAEFHLIRQHVVLGQKLLETEPSLVDVARIVRTHHERWDGAGYPDGLAGADVPLTGRVLHVVDCLDAMLRARWYKQAYPISRVLAELIRCRGTQFDPSVVDATIAWVEAGGLGQAPQPVAA